MGRQPVQITLAPSFNPEVVEASEATPWQLYDAWEAWNLLIIRSERDEPAARAHAKNEARLQMGRVERELRRRGFPSPKHRRDHTFYTRTRDDTTWWTTVKFPLSATPIALSNGVTEIYITRPELWGEYEEVE